MLPFFKKKSPHPKTIYLLLEDGSSINIPFAKGVKNNHCLKAYFSLEKKPTKAALHFDEEIGRKILEQCDVLNKPFLISGKLLDYLDFKKEFAIEDMGDFELREGERPICVFSMIERK